MPIHVCEFHHFPLIKDGCTCSDSCISIKRDINNLFKFNVGDKVMKRWKWSKEQLGRFEDLDLNLKGTISKIYPSGEICINFDLIGNHHVGASELDFVESEIPEEINEVC